MAHKYAPWRRAILVPIWTIQLGVMALIIALLLFAAGNLFRYSDSYSTATKSALKVTVSVWCSLSACCALLTISNIVMLTRRKLKQLHLLISSVVQSVIWTGLFILDALSWARDTVTAATALGIVIELIAVLSFYAALIYASIMYNRLRKERRAYNPLSQPSNDTTYHSQLHTVHHDVESGGPTAYNAQTSGVVSAYDPYKPAYNNHGDLGLAQQHPVEAGPGVPKVYVQSHENVYEMEGRRNLH